MVSSIISNIRMNENNMTANQLISEIDKLGVGDLMRITTRFERMYVLRRAGMIEVASQCLMEMEVYGMEEDSGDKYLLKLMNKNNEVAALMHTDKIDCVEVLE